MRKDWHDLECECGCKEFRPLYKIRWHPSHGTSNDLKQFRCNACGDKVNQDKMARRLRYKWLEEDLGEQKEQMDREMEDMETSEIAAMKQEDMD